MQRRKKSLQHHNAKHGLVFCWLQHQRSDYMQEFLLAETAECHSWTVLESLITQADKKLFSRMMYSGTFHFLTRETCCFIHFAALLWFTQHSTASQVWARDPTLYHRRPLHLNVPDVAAQLGFTCVRDGDGTRAARPPPRLRATCVSVGGPWRTANHAPRRAESPLHLIQTKKKHSTCWFHWRTHLEEKSASLRWNLRLGVGKWPREGRDCSSQVVERPKKIMRKSWKGCKEAANFYVIRINCWLCSPHEQPGIKGFDSPQSRL